MDLLDLLPQHAALLHESCIHPEIAKERCYMSVRVDTDGRLLKSRGFSAKQRSTPGLLIPLFGIDGAPITWEKHGKEYLLAQYRPDTPRIGSDGRIVKYETPSGSSARIDCHPACLHMLGNPTIPLWITEGVRKGDSLVSAGACALALLGVDMWRNQVDWTLMRSMVKGRHVIVCFDSDARKKKEVSHAQQRLCTMLAEKGALVQVCQLPEFADMGKTGIDDYLAAGYGIDDALALCVPWEDPEAPQKALATHHDMALSYNKDGGIKPIASNLIEILLKDPAWDGVFQYDTFSQRGMVCKPPPFHHGAPFEARQIKDIDDISVKVWFERSAYGIFPSTRVCYESIEEVTKLRQFHPVRDYLRTLVWDGVSRIDSWLTTYLGAEDTPYHRAVGAKWLIAAIARIEVPGCRVDNALVLETSQGRKKSTTLQILAVNDAWFTDSIPDMHSKDAMQGLVGKWIVELGELSVLKRSELEAVKTFLTSRQDSYRPSYGRRTEDFPRTCIFAATTNRNDYLRDDTGNRRFWPVHMDICDDVALRRDVGQLWAEACVRYQSGEPWWLGEHELPLAHAAQSARMEIDEWQEAIIPYIQSHTRLQARDILWHVFQIPPDKHDLTALRRIGSILRKLGWVHKPVNVDGRLVKYFIKPAGQGDLCYLEGITRGSGVTDNKTNDFTYNTNVTYTYSSSSSSKVDIERNIENTENRDIYTSSMETEICTSKTGNEADANPPW